MLQYLATIILNKNTNKLKNKALITDIFLVIATIVIPIGILIIKIEMNINIVPLFIILYAFFRFLNNNVHKMYITNKEDEIKEKTNIEKQNKIIAIKYSFILIVTAVTLFIVGELLGNSIENLCKLFNVPEFMVGVLLGFITSIPELIAFLEAQRNHKKEENKIYGVVEATNNLLTSNIINLFVVQTVAIIITINR